MQIDFERSGGFAGIRFQSAIDTDQLSPLEAAPLIDLIHQAHFYDLPERMTADENQADRFLYRLTIRDGGRAHTVTMDAGSIPLPLQPLIDQLTRAARTPRRD